MKENNKSQKEKLRLWLLDNPGINPYRFSFDKLFRILTNSQRLLPDFIIIGSTRSGTWTLTDFLMQHPNIFMERNLHFFQSSLSLHFQVCNKFYQAFSILKFEQQAHVLYRHFLELQFSYNYFIS